MTPLLTLLASTTALSPPGPEARYVALFDVVTPHLSCLRDDLAGIGTDDRRAAPGEELTLFVRGQVAAAERKCAPALGAAMTKLRIPKEPIPAGEVATSQRRYALQALVGRYKATMFREALDGYQAKVRGTTPRGGSAYGATLALMPFFSCFEDAFRKHPDAFTRNHDRIRAARAAAEQSCRSLQDSGADAAGNDLGWPGELDAEAFRNSSVGSALGTFKEDLVRHQLRLNGAEPPPLPPQAPPPPVPPPPASPSSDPMALPPGAYVLVKPYAQCLWTEFERAPGLETADTAAQQAINAAATTACSDARQQVTASADSFLRETERQMKAKDRGARVARQLREFDTSVLREWLQMRPILKRNSVRMRRAAQTPERVQN